MNIYNTVKDIDTKIVTSDYKNERLEMTRITKGIF